MTWETIVSVSELAFWSLYAIVGLLIVYGAVDVIRHWDTDDQ